MGSNLSIWLSENGFTKETIGFFALAGLPFSLKILWSPIIDQIRLPFFKNSPRKGWLFFALATMGLSVLGLGFTDPKETPLLLLFCLLSLSLFSGCLHIIGLSYELEIQDEKLYSIGSATVISGYRIGLLCAGAFALYIAFLYGWQLMFLTLASLLFIASILVLFHPEPYKSAAILQAKKEQYSRYPSHLHGFWHEVILEPCKEFLKRNNIGLLLFFILLFKAPDQFFKQMEGPFYLDMGFDKQDLALASKLCGFIGTIAGAAIGGLFLRNKDPLRSSAAIGLVHTISLVFYWLHATLPAKSYPLLYATSAVTNFTGGMAMTAFIYLLWRLCNKKYASIQYTFLWSFYTFKGDFLAASGGIFAANSTWDHFFLMICLVGVAGALLAWQIAFKIQTSNFKIKSI
jgi:MFS transporter, PAT family, beta-lactamase induction signal transducer AmpG